MLSILVSFLIDLFCQVELSIKGNNMFIGTVLKAIEVEDLICRKGKSHFCYLARSVIRSADAPSLSDVSGNETSLSGDLSQGEGDDQFYEASETLNDENPQSVGTEPEYFSSQNFLSSNNTIRALSFSRLADLLPTDNNYSGSGNPAAAGALDSFVKAQIVVYDKNSSVHDGIETKVSCLGVLVSSSCSYLFAYSSYTLCPLLYRWQFHLLPCHCFAAGLRFWPSWISLVL